MSWGGWGLVFLVLTTPQGGLIVGGLLLAAAVLGPMLLARRGRPVPAWVATKGEGWSWPIDSGPGLGHVLIVGGACGLGGAAAIWVFRSLAGPAASDSDNSGRFFDYALVAAAAGVVGMAVLSVSRGGRGAAASFVALPVAAVTTLLGFVVLNGALGGSFPLGLLFTFVGAALTAAVTAAVPLAAMALLSPAAESAATPVEAAANPAAPGIAARPVAATVPGPAVPPAHSTPPSRWPRLVAIPVVAFVSAALLGGTIPVLKPSSGGSIPLGETSDETSEELYLQAVAAPLEEGFAAMLDSVTAIVAAELEDPAVIAQRIRDDLLPLLERMRVTATAYEPPTARLQEIHESAELAIDAYRTGYADLAAAYDAGDAKGSRAAAARVAQGASDLREWLAATGSLGG